MKKLVFLALVLLSCSVAFAEGGTGIGYDGDLKMLMYRHNLGENKLDLGVGLDFTNDLKNKLAFGVAGFYLMPVTKFMPSFTPDEKFNVNVYGGGIFDYDHSKDANFAIAAGLQPEYYVHPRISLETRFGVNMHLTKGFYFRTFGNSISITGGLGFKVFF